MLHLAGNLRYGRQVTEEEPIDAHVIDNIRAFRRNAGLTQEAFARKLQEAGAASTWTQGRVSRMETGRVALEAWHVKIIARALGVDRGLLEQRGKADPALYEELREKLRVIRRRARTAGLDWDLLLDSLSTPRAPIPYTPEARYAIESASTGDVPVE